jgi:hypothetical protein
MGPKSKGWKAWCEFFNINPKTGELPKDMLHLCVDELKQSFRFPAGEGPRECELCGETAWGDEACRDCVADDIDQGTTNLVPRETLEGEE